MTFKKITFAASIILLITSCAIRMNEAIPTSTELLTATIPPTMTVSPSDTPLPSPPQPTVVPVEGTSSTQINVRSEPSTSGSVLGIIPPNTIVQIIGKDPGGNWWQIIYTQSTDGKGWVTAQYITIAKEVEVPVIGGNAGDPNNGNIAIAQQQINIRSGPGTSFNSLGTLNAKDVVNLTGRDSNGTWLQIAYPAGPEGKGWVNASFVQARGVENLPIVAESGQVVGTGTPTAIPFTPTPTVMPAWGDNDSQDNPVANVVFESDGTNSLIYSGDISTPEGDGEDWVSFKPYNENIYVSLICTKGDILKAELFENRIPLNTYVTCGESIKKINVKPGQVYSIHLYATITPGELQYSRYTIRIQTSP